MSISNAVRYQINVLAHLGQAKLALLEISRRIAHQPRPDDRLVAAITTVSETIHRRITETWENLAILSPLDNEARAILQERTETWFSDDMTSLFRLTEGFYGQNEVELRQEAMRIFGCKYDETGARNTLSVRVGLSPSEFVKPWKQERRPLIGVWLAETPVVKTVMYTDLYGNETWKEFSNNNWTECDQPDFWITFPVFPIQDLKEGT